MALKFLNDGYFAGSVGIGTASPLGELHVKNVSELYTDLDGSDAAVNFLDNNLDVWRIGIRASDNSFRFSQDATSLGTNVRVTIADGGNVGIGTTSPNYVLDISKDNGSILNLHRPNSSTAAASFLDFSFNTANATEAVYARIRSDVEVNTDSAQGGDLSFHTANAGTVGEVMRLTQEGNVGIGTTSPNANLDILNGTTGASLKLSATSTAYWQLQRDSVTGNLNISDDALGNVMSFDQLTGNVGIGTTAPGASLEVDGSFNVKNGDNAITHFNYVDGSTNYLRGVTYFDTNSVYFTGGNVGIGTTSPSVLLDVWGATPTIRAVGTSASNPSLTLASVGITAWSQTVSGSDSSLSFNKDGSEKMRIDTSGNVGIGTASPSQKLEVAGNTLINNSGDGKLYLGSTSDYIGNIGSDIYMYSSGQNIFYAGGSEKMRITSAGNVGIGTTSPGNKLEVRGVAGGNHFVVGSTGYDLLKVAGSSITMQPYPLGNGTDGIYIKAYDSGYALRDVIRVINASAATSPHLLLQPSGGNVGIGTTSPGDNLQLNVANGKGITVSYTGTTDGEGSSLSFKYGGNNTYTSAQVSSIKRAGGGGDLVLSSGNTLSSYSEIMRLTKEGNVGIGTTSPGALLEVDNQTFSNTKAIGNFVNGNNPVRVVYDTVVVAQTDVATLSLVETVDGSQANEQKLTFSVGDGSAVIRSTSPVANGIYINVAAANSAPGYQTTSGLNAIRVLNNGNSIFNYNVGIGTTAPVVKLDVLGLTNTSIFNLRQSSGLLTQIESDNGYANLFLYQAGNNPKIGLVSNGSSFFNGGNVGIGTISPAQKLQVIGGNIAVDNTYGYHIKDAAGTLRWALRAQAADDLEIGDSGFDDMLFTVGGVTNAMVIKQSTGNVGIGTTSPDVRLEVVEASPTNGVVADFVNSTNAGGTTAAIKLSNADSDVCDVVLGANRIGANYGSDFFISPSDGVDGTNQERFRITEAGAIKFNAYGAGTLVSDASGNITSTTTPPGTGVFLPLAAGSSSPLTNALFVTGEASNGATINLGNTAAYRGILSYTGASATTLSLSNTYDTAASRIDFNLRTAGTPVTALRLEGSGNATFAGNVDINGTGNNSIAGDLYFGVNADIFKTSGDLTLDVAGDIVLDADGGDVVLKDNGTSVGRLGLENGDLNLAAAQQDYDIRLKGNDGGTIITALHLDMSEGGDATFSTQAFATTATSSGDASSTLTTKGYVDSLITGATIYRGTWDPDVALNSGYGSPNLSTVTHTSGYYYICSADGAATPNGATTEPNTWNTGDWVIWNDDIGASGEWQKIDNSSVLSGVGTGQTVALWEGASSVTDSETLGNAPITVSGNNTTFAGNVTAAGTILSSTQLKAITSSGGVSGYFTDAVNSTFQIKHASGQLQFLNGSNNIWLTENGSQQVSFSGAAFFTAPGVAAYGSINLESEDPFIRLYDNGAGSATDKKKWDIRAIGFSGYESFDIRTVNDANTVFSTKLSIAHNGNATFAGNVMLDVNNWLQGHVTTGSGTQGLIRSRAMGYPGYYGCQVGEENNHIALFIDPNSVAGGSFSGNISELMLPNRVDFKQANAVTSPTNWISSPTLSLNDGNVGIGTGSPGAKLDVSGEVRTSSNFIADNATLGSLSLRISGTETGRLDNYNSALRLINFHASSATVISGNGDISIESIGSSDIKFSTSNAEKMRITSAGNVLIGVTSALGRELLVKGEIAAINHTGANDNQILMAVDSTVGNLAVTYGTTGSYIPFQLETGGIPRMVVSTAGAIKFNSYDSTNNTGTPTYLLGTDASGNVVKTLTTPSPITSQAASLYDLIPNGAFTITKSLTLVNGVYQEVTKGSELITATGTYAVSMYVSNSQVGGGQYYETYSGTMTWFKDATNSSGEGAISEISLHRAGHHAQSSSTYLRTREAPNEGEAKLILEVMTNVTLTGASNIIFKFVRLI